MILVALEIILIFPMFQLLIRTFLVLISYPVISVTTRTEIFRSDYNTYKKSINYYIVRLRSKKAGRFEKLLGFARSYSIVTRGSVSLSCATSTHSSCFSKYFINKLLYYIIMKVNKYYIEIIL